MAKKHGSSKVKGVLFCLLSFILSLTLFMISILVVLEATAFNSEFILDNMNASDYFIDKKDEIKTSLKDLGYASGLEESFFDDLFDEVLLSNNTQKYLKDYYSGVSKKVDTTEFKQIFNAALDEYIKEKGLTDVSESAREYLVNHAATIYYRSIEIPLFSVISSYLLTAKKVTPIIILGLLLFAAIIVAILFVANKWKHRAVKYCCYATITSFLTLGIIPAAAFATGIINKINIPSRALYNLFVRCANNVMLAFLFCALMFLVFSVGLYFLYYKKRKRLKHS